MSLVMRSPFDLCLRAMDRCLRAVGRQRDNAEADTDYHRAVPLGASAKPRKVRLPPPCSRERRIHRHDHATIGRLYSEQHLAARRAPFIAKLFVDPPKTFKIATRRRALRIDGAAALPWPAMPAPCVDRLIELGHVGQLAAQGANSAGPLRHLSRHPAP